MSAALGYALFDTAFGPLRAWGAAGLRAVQLPEVDDAATVARLLRAGGPCDAELPTAEATAAIQDIQALLQGQPLDLREVRLDMAHLSEFHQRVYALTRAIAPGQVRTYGDLAQALGGRVGPRRGTSAGAEPVCAGGALPPGAGCGVPCRGLFRQRRSPNQAAYAADRRRALGRNAVVARVLRGPVGVLQNTVTAPMPGAWLRHTGGPFDGETP